MLEVERPDIDSPSNPANKEPYSTVELARSREAETTEELTNGD